MKKSKILLSILLIILIGGTAVFTIYKIVPYYLFIRPRLSTTYNERKIKLNNSADITIIDENGNKKEIDHNNELYTHIYDIFNNKRIKVVDDRAYLYGISECIVEIDMQGKKYVLHAAPEMIDGKLGENVVFVVYDYTNNSTMDYLYQIVTVSTEEFYSIFPDWHLENW